MQKSKRNLAKLLGVAGTAAVVWKKPVVDGIVLPAHATLSALIFSDPSASANLAGGNSSGEQRDTYGCVTVMGDTASVVIAGVNEFPPNTLAIRRGTLNLPAPLGSGGDGVITTTPGEFNSSCILGSLSLTARILSISDTSVQVQWDRPNGGTATLSLPVANSCAPEPEVIFTVCD